MDEVFSQAELDVSLASKEFATLHNTNERLVPGQGHRICLVVFAI